MTSPRKHADILLSKIEGYFSNQKVDPGHVRLIKQHIWNHYGLALKLTEGRLLSQNDLLHVLIREILQYCKDNDIDMPYMSEHKTKAAAEEHLKRNFIYTFCGTDMSLTADLKTGEVKQFRSLPRTSEMDKGRISHLITCIYAWAAEHEIPVSRPADSEYMKLMREMGSAV